MVVVVSSVAGCSPARTGAGAGALLGATGAMVAGAKETDAIVAARAAVAAAAAAAAAADLAVARSPASASLAALAKGLTFVHFSAQRKHFFGIRCEDSVAKRHKSGSG